MTHLNDNLSSLQEVLPLNFMTSCQNFDILTLRDTSQSADFIRKPALFVECIVGRYGDYLCPK